MHLWLNLNNVVFNYKKYNDYELLYLLQWHCEEALTILMKKYDNLIIIKLNKFKVLKFHFNDYVQELRMTVLHAINRYSEYYEKTLCRFIELLVDRKIIKLLNEDKLYSDGLVYIEDSLGYNGEKILDEMIYEERIREINQVKLDDFKKDLLENVLIRGETIKHFSARYNVSTKEVYNQVYAVRLKLKNKINL